MDQCNSNRVKLNFTVPYYHQINGQVERLNRTIRDGLRKTRGQLSIKLLELIANYDKYMMHRESGFTPKEGLQIENRKSILDKAYNCKKTEFKSKSLQRF